MYFHNTLKLKYCNTNIAVIIIILFPAENVDSHENESSDNSEEGNTEKFDQERNVIITSSVDRCGENDEYEIYTTEELNEEGDV